MKQLLLFLFTIVLAGTAFAIEVNSIYQADVPVASQSEQDRIKAIPQGLAQVFVKVSGRTAVLENAQVKAQLHKAATLMQQYGYSSTDKGEFLKVQFDPEGVNQILRNAQASTWGQDRPLILVWAEYEVPFQTAEVLDSDSTSETHTLLKQYAHQRGLPFLFPMMDVTDLNQVSVNDIVTLSVPTLQNAAKRYASDGILVARVIQTANDFTIHAKLALADKTWNWDISAKTYSDAATQLVDKVAETLAARYASVVTNAVQTQLTVKITGITQQDDFAQVLNYIQHIAAVADAQPTKISGNEVALEVNLRGTREAFVQAVALDKKLTIVQNEPNDPLIVYQWNISHAE